MIVELSLMSLNEKREIMEVIVATIQPMVVALAVAKDCPGELFDIRYGGREADAMHRVIDIIIIRSSLCKGEITIISLVAGVASLGFHTKDFEGCNARVVTRV